MRMMKPARKTSSVMIASSSSGPSVGRLSTTDTMMLPLTRDGSRYPTVLISGLIATRTGILQDGPQGPQTLGPGRDHVGLAKLVEQVVAHHANQPGGARRSENDGGHPQVVQQVLEPAKFHGVFA